MQKPAKPIPQPCPCQSGLSYPQCCEPAHHGTPPASPGALMRSRYSAYVLGLESYLLQSWHPDTRPEALDFDSACKWLGLSVLAESSDGEQGSVEFVARFRLGGGKAQRLHERSRFVRIAQRWLYLDGEIS